MTNKRPLAKSHLFNSRRIILVIFLIFASNCRRKIVSLYVCQLFCTFVHRSICIVETTPSVFSKLPLFSSVLLCTAWYCPMTYRAHCKKILVLRTTPFNPRSKLFVLELNILLLLIGFKNKKLRTYIVVLYQHFKKPHCTLSNCDPGLILWSLNLCHIFTADPEGAVKS